MSFSFSSSQNLQPEAEMNLSLPSGFCTKVFTPTQISSRSQAQREWEKVAGRFEEILFDQPLEQITHLIGAALNVAEEHVPRGWVSKALV